MSNTIYGLKVAMEKNDFERLKSSNRKLRNDFVANPILPMHAYGIFIKMQFIKKFVGTISLKKNAQSDSISAHISSIE